MARSSVVLGFSGLDGGEEFRRASLPGGSSGELRFFQGQDAAAAVLVDGVLVAAVQQERFSRTKFDGAFPSEAIRSCLELAGVEDRDITHVAHNFDFSGMRSVLATSAYDAALFDAVYDPRLQQELVRKHLGLRAEVAVTPVRHHTAHAYSGVVPSGLDRCAVLIADGMGELESVSIALWEDGRLRRLRSLGPASSLGLFYSLITMHLGFLPSSDEYKVMGLAPFGDPARFRGDLTDMVRLTSRGVAVPLLDWSDGRHRYLRSRALLADSLSAPRAAGGPVEAVHLDVAAAAQERLTECLVHLARLAVELTGEPRLVFAGGVALNCSAVGTMATSGEVASVFVPPAASDEGTAIGAAAAVSPTLEQAAWPGLPLLGPLARSDSSLPTPTATLPLDRVTALVAELLLAGAVVGWVRGRLEFGPRALGNRSVLAAATSTDIRDRVNRMIKGREDFRPLAPAIKAERVNEWFVVPPGAELRYMTTTVRVREPLRSRILGVVHVDGTSRVQTVDATEHPDFWRLLDAYEALSGLPMVLNTSLNVTRMPIALSARHAYDVFERAGLDLLAVGEDVWVAERWRSKVAELLR